MVRLTTLDWVWIVLYLLLMVGCGLLFYRLGKRSEADFFLAGFGPEVEHFVPPPLEFRQ